jgi:hypothetical protein
MNGEQMIDSFFSGEIGKTILKESTDKSLALRRQLSIEIEEQKALLQDSSNSNKIKKLHQAQEKARNALKVAEDAYSVAVREQYTFNKARLNKIKILELELVEASPDFIQICINKLRNKRQIVGVLSRIAAVEVKELLDHIRGWSLSAKNFDEMAIEFEEIERKFEGVLLKQKPAVT